MNRAKVRGRWNARGAAIKQQQRHDIKLGFKTRIHGSSKQVGNVFPIGQAKKLPNRIGAKAGQWKTANEQSRSKLKEDLKLSAGSYALSITFKDGSSEIKRIESKDFDNALGQADIILDSYRGKKEIKSINLLAGGKLGEDIKNVFAGTVSKFKNFAAPRISKLAKGEYKIGENIENASTKLGEIAAFPGRVSKAYQRGADPDAAMRADLQKQLADAMNYERLSRLQSSIDKYGKPYPQSSSQFSLVTHDIPDRIDQLISARNAEAKMALQNREPQEVISSINREISDLRILRAKSIAASPNTLTIIDQKLRAMGGKTHSNSHKVSFKAHGKKVSFMVGGKKSKAKPNWKRQSQDAYKKLDFNASSRAVANMPSRRP